MVKIKVTPELLRDVARQVWRVSDTLARVEVNLNRADNYLDAGNLEGNVRWRVENSIGRAKNKVERLGSQTSELAQELERIAERFESADMRSLQGVNQFTAITPATGSGMLSYSVAGSSSLWMMGALAGSEEGGGTSSLHHIPTGSDNFGLDVSSELVALTREHKIWPERRGRPRDHHPEVKISIWDGELWKAPENAGHTMFGGLRFGGETHVKAGAYEAGIKGEFDDGISVGPYVGVTAFTAGMSGVIGSKDAGLAGGLDVKAGEAEAFFGVKDSTVGAKIGAKLVSAEATVGGNIGGTYVGVVGGIGVEFELGIAIGKKTRIDLGPFTLGLDIGEALGA